MLDHIGGSTTFINQAYKYRILTQLSHIFGNISCYASMKIFYLSCIPPCRKKLSIRIPLDIYIDSSDSYNSHNYLLYSLVS